MKHLLFVIGCALVCLFQTFSAQAQATTSIFNQFPWIADNNLVQEEECTSEQIAIYQSGIFQYILITDTNGISKLYNQYGTYYCQNASNYDCIAVYSLGMPIEIWACGGSDGLCAITITNNECRTIGVYDEQDNLLRTMQPAPQPFVPIDIPPSTWEDTRLLGPNTTQTYIFKENNLVLGQQTASCENNNIRVISNQGGGCSDILLSARLVNTGCRPIRVMNTSGRLITSAAPGETFEISSERNIQILLAGEDTLAVDTRFRDGPIDSGGCKESNEEVFKEYPWLTSKIDPITCNEGAVSVYQYGTYKFLFVTIAGTGTLYFQDGTFYCSNTNGYDCLAAYNLDAALCTWTCEGNGNENEECEVTIRNTQCRRIGVYDEANRLLTTIDYGPFGIAPSDTPTPEWTDPTPLAENETRTYLLKEGNFLLATKTVSCGNNNITTSNTYPSGCNDALSIDIYTNTGCRTLSIVGTNSEVIDILEPNELVALTATNNIYIFLAGTDTIDIKADTGGGIDSGGCLLNCLCSSDINPVCGTDGNTYSNSCEANCVGVEVAYNGPCNIDPNGTQCFPSFSNTQCKPIGIFNEAGEQLTLMPAASLGEVINIIIPTWLDPMPLQVGESRTYILKDELLIVARKTLTCEDSRTTTSNPYSASCDDGLSIGNFTNTGCRKLTVNNTAGTTLFELNPNETAESITVTNEIFIFLVGTDTIDIKSDVGGDIDSGGCDNNGDNCFITIANNQCRTIGIYDEQDRLLSTLEPGPFGFVVAEGPAPLWSDPKPLAEKETRTYVLKEGNFVLARKTVSCEQSEITTSNAYPNACNDGLSIGTYTNTGCLAMSIMSTSGNLVSVLQPGEAKQLVATNKIYIFLVGNDTIDIKADAWGEIDSGGCESNECSVTITNRECRRIGIYDEADNLLATLRPTPFSLIPGENQPIPMWRDSVLLAADETRTYILKEGNFILATKTVSCENSTITTANSYAQGCNDGLSFESYRNRGCRAVSIVNTSSEVIAVLQPEESIELTSTNNIYIFLVGTDTVDIKSDIAGNIDSGGCDNKDNPCITTISNTQCRTIGIYDEEDRLLSTLEPGPFGFGSGDAPIPQWTDPTPLSPNEARTYILKEGNFILTRKTASCENTKLTTDNPYAQGCNDGLSIGTYSNVGCRTMTIVNTRNNEISQLQPGASQILTATNNIYIFLVGNDTIDIKSDAWGEIDSGGCDREECFPSINNTQCKPMGIFNEAGERLTLIPAAALGEVIEEFIPNWVDPNPLQQGETRTYILKDELLEVARKTVTCGNASITTNNPYAPSCNDALSIGAFTNTGCKDLIINNTKGIALANIRPSESFEVTTTNNVYILLVDGDTLAIKSEEAGDINTGGCIDGTYPSIFEDYSWLSSKVNPFICSTEKVDIYQQGTYRYILVTDKEGFENLYNQDGLFYCQNSSNYDCIAAYNLGSPVESWTCDNSNIVCAELYNPVCGEDGNTYSNACEAGRAGVAINYDGECEQLLCPDLFEPVCGSDGRTYANSCEAEQAGVEIVSFGLDCKGQTYDPQLPIQESAQDLFSQFDWLSTIIDENDCEGTSVFIYDQGSYSYVYVADENGENLYYQDGTFYCQKSENYDCIAAYRLNDPSSAWTCANFTETESEERESREINSITPNLTAFPNPTTGLLNIEIDNVHQHTQQLRIMNVMGKTIIQEEITPATNTIALDLSTYQNGIYYLELRSRGKRVVKKVIKQDLD